VSRAITYASLLVLVASSDAFADQEVHVAAGMTGSTVGISDRNGVGMVVEIKGMANDMLAIGGRVEIAMMFGGHLGSDDLALDFAMIGCGLLKAEYYLVPGQIRPFVSLGAGAYSVGSQSVGSGPNTAGIMSQTSTHLGFAPQIGIDLSRVRLAVTYNAIVGARLEFVEMGNGSAETRSASQNYLSLELSFRFGGGRSPAPPPSQPPAYRPQPYPQPYPQPQPQPQPQPY
jgi:hypothetical protein